MRQISNTTVHMTPFSPREMKRDKTPNSLPKKGRLNDRSIAVMTNIKKKTKGNGGQCEEFPPVEDKSSFDRSSRDVSQNPAPTSIGENCAASRSDASASRVFVAQRHKAEQDINSPEAVERKIKALLNKLAQRTLESISGQVLEYVNRSTQEQDGQTMTVVIRLIIDKAAEDQFWAKLYAQLCEKIWKGIDKNVQCSSVYDSAHALKGRELFRHCLLTQCQQAFLAGLLEQRSKDAVVEPTVSIDDNLEKSLAVRSATHIAGATTEDVFSDEYYTKESIKRKLKGFIKLMGELYNVAMLGTLAILQIFTLLVDDIKENVDEFRVKLACGLLVTIGSELQRREERLSRTEKLENISERLRGFRDDPRTSFRTSCYLQATIGLLEKPSEDPSTVHAANFDWKPQDQLIPESAKTIPQHLHGMRPTSTVLQITNDDRQTEGSSVAIAMPKNAAKEETPIPSSEIYSLKASVHKPTNVVSDIYLESQEAAKEAVSKIPPSTPKAVNPSPSEAMPNVSSTSATPPIQPLFSSGDLKMNDTSSAAPSSAPESSTGLNPNMLIDIKRILGTSNANNAKQCGIQLIEKINDCAPSKAGRVLQSILLELFENVKTVGCVYLTTSRKPYPERQDTASQTAIIVKTIWSMADSHIQLEGFVSSTGSQVRGAKLCKEVVASMLRSELTIVWEDCDMIGEGPRTEINENGRVVLDFAVKLFMADQLSPKIIYECLRRLLADISSPYASDIDQLCRILVQTGAKLDRLNSSALAVYLTRFKLLRRIAISDASLKNIETVIEMAESGWRAPSNRNVPVETPPVRGNQACQLCNILRDK